MLLSDLCALMNTREGAAMLCVCLFVCFFEDISKTFLGKEIRERETLSKVSTRIHIKKKKALKLCQLAECRIWILLQHQPLSIF